MIQKRRHHPGKESRCRFPTALCSVAQLCIFCNRMGNFSCTAPYMILVNGTLLPRRQSPYLFVPNDAMSYCMCISWWCQPEFWCSWCEPGDGWPMTIFYLPSRFHCKWGWWCWWWWCWWWCDGVIQLARGDHHPSTLHLPIPPIWGVCPGIPLYRQIPSDGSQSKTICWTIRQPPG